MPIHTLYENDRAERMQNGGFNKQWMKHIQYIPQSINTVEENKILFISGSSEKKPPRNQKYYHMFKYNCCTTIKCCSLTMLLIFIYTALFIAQCIVGINKQGSLLEVSQTTARTMGANIPQLIRNGEVWRVITAAVLHVNFLHYFGNVLATLVLVSRVEYTLGAWRLLILVILAGIGGNIFSALASFDAIKMGASTSIFGALGFCIGYIILNWRGLKTIDQMLRYHVIYTAVMFLIFGVISTSSPNVDIFGHLGGFLIGVWGTGMQKQFFYEKREKIMRWVFVGIMVFQLILTFTIFYTIYPVKTYFG